MSSTTVSNQLPDGSGNKTVYFTKVTVDGDNQLSPVSDDLYQSIFNRILADPLQKVDSAFKSCEDIQKKLLFTGLFQSAEITLDHDVDVRSSRLLTENVPKELDIELPIPTIAQVKLVPAVYNKGSLTTTTRDTYSSAGGRLFWINKFGNAETISLQGDVNYTPFNGKLDERLLGAKLALPFPKNPSVKAAVYANHAYLDLFKQPFIGESDEHKQSQFGLSAGIEKNFLYNNNKSVIETFNGVAMVARNIYGFADALAVSDSIKQFQGTFTKSSFISELKSDSRKFYNRFPVSGKRVQLFHEYILSQGFTNSKPLPHESNFDKVSVSYETHRPFFNTKLVTSLHLDAGAIFPWNNKSKPLVHLLDSFYLGGPKSLKGFERNCVGDRGGLYFYKLGISSSFKLPNTPIDSPLRLQSFINFGDVLNNWRDANLDRKPALSTGISLIYSASFANLDLSYSLPLRVRDYDIAKPGLTFGLDLSFF
ncbi:hypothetical protein KDRO_F09620 [Kluyveromyces lactis]|nr:hypothetical protein KDRO_F09620 [Kluyveromyces lactis]